MAKLRANITYNRRKQESNLNMAHIDIESEEQELQNVDLNEQNKESNSDDHDNVENALNIEDEIGENDDEIEYGDGDIEEEETQVQNKLDQWLKILQENNNEDLDDLNFDLDIESIDHPAENSQAKWDLKIMFKENLHCPF